MDDYLSKGVYENELTLYFDIQEEKPFGIGEKMNEINENAYMNGYNWEAFLNYYLSLRAPDVLEGMITDPEAGLYAAYYEKNAENEVRMNKFIEIIRYLVENEDELYRFIRAEGENIDWDGWYYSDKAEQNMSLNNFIIRQSKIFLWIFIVGAVFFGGVTIAAILFPDDTATWWIYVFFFTLSFGCVFMAYYCKCWTVTVTGDIITLKYIFKKTKTFHAKEITRIRSKLDGIIIYCNGKRAFAVEDNCVGYNVFIEWLKMKRIEM